MKKHLATGKHGEEIAARFLANKGYDILERNYRHKKSEIDIIAQLGDLLVFVEVKSRTNIAFGYPEEAVGQAKIEKVLEGAEQYTYEHHWDGDIRFDIVAITYKPNLEVVHFKDAFY